MSILDKRDPTRPYLIAHRGSSALCPENTVQAFRQAVQDGADIVETDVHLTSDGHFVLIHDPTLERTTEGKGRVRDHTLTQVRKVLVRGNCGQGGAASVPTLEEMVNAVPSPVVLALELKARDFGRLEACEAFIGALDRAGVRDRTLILSSRRRHLHLCKRVAPEIPVGLVSWVLPWPMAGVDLLGPPWPVLALNPFYVRIAHRRGQLVCPLDSCPDPRLSLYLRMGCDAVASDDPGRTRRSAGFPSGLRTPAGGQ